MADRSSRGEREDNAVGLLKELDHGIELLPVAQRVRILEVGQARRLKELEQESAKLMRLVTELSLYKLVRKDVATASMEWLS